LAKVQELESNNFRAQFSNRSNGFKNENKYQGNNLRFDQKRQNNNTTKWDIIGVITRIIIGYKREIFGKTIIKITIKSNKPSSQWILIHRFNSRINLIIIGSRIIIGRQIIIEVDIIIIIIKIITPVYKKIDEIRLSGNLCFPVRYISLIKKRALKIFSMVPFFF